ncbi:hypothetical protein FBZ87_101637 [Nitrospirillum amazonense]|uniref:Lipase (Class 3) n=1 Tax=Nitrospirillum amazonense TaxID=28077 RepID=A0A560KI44_9PROT|nr:hypothetical protein [Nitrospirillum amazonense]TWB82925.1 hypothetical protein FBZ87_101637 [Nitrospirillum amazonense]
MVTTYDAWQTTFFFNNIANDAGGQDVTVDLDKSLPKNAALQAGATAAAAQLTAILTTGVDKAIKAAGSQLGADDWTVVWGPQVLCINPVALSVRWEASPPTARFNAANALFVVYSPTLARYVVAIAATNFKSFYDWLKEDFAVATVVAWEGALQMWNGGTNDTQPSAQIPCISMATYTGITNLLGIIDTQITQQTLVAFLKGLTPPAGTTLTFTGHSLAGALSPTLAMACFDPTAGLLQGSSWTAGDAMIYATAGATPGNAPFAALVNGTGWAGADQTGSQPWQIWNHDMYNNVDVVPHAWGSAMLDAIPGYYGTYYGALTTDLITHLISHARAHAKKGEAVAGPYTPINNQALNPEGQPAAFDEFVSSYKVSEGGGEVIEYLTPAQAAAVSPPPTDKTQVSWTEQVLFQHTTAYGQLILQNPPQPVKLPS